MALSRKEKAIKRKWLAALRSGNYSQTTGCLFRDKEEAAEKGKPHGYCCLGVLQHVLNGGVQTTDSGLVNGRPTDEWYLQEGIDSKFIYDEDGLSGIEDALVNMNDGSGGCGKKNFLEIADYIEEKWV